tara:strand:+ start:811 stop:1017 length:207 start_codon:yes stop_codon:yes gene_type:complete
VALERQRSRSLTGKLPATRVGRFINATGKDKECFHFQAAEGSKMPFLYLAEKKRHENDGVTFQELGKF